MGRFRFLHSCFSPLRILIRNPQKRELSDDRPTSPDAVKYINPLASPVPPRGRCRGAGGWLAKAEQPRRARSVQPTNCSGEVGDRDHLGSFFPFESNTGVARRFPAEREQALSRLCFFFGAAPSSSGSRLHAGSPGGATPITITVWRAAFVK